MQDFNEDYYESSESDDYDRSYYGKKYRTPVGSAIPDVIKNFLKYFCNAIKEGNLYEIQDLYENTFPKLTEEYYEKVPWPEWDSIYQLVDEDEVFQVLYKELYYRHIYARIQGGPSLQQRFDSFYNYCNLFNLIIHTEKPVGEKVPLELPDVWLWEIIDDFVYQFQTFTQYKARANKSSAELKLLNDGANSRVWDVLCILNVLHSLIDKPNIKIQLEVLASGGDPDSVAGEFGQTSLYKMFGYFSLVGLLRLHTLLGDYYLAVKSLESIDIHQKHGVYATVPACQITMSYYVGFSYMMMRRYSDAIRTFSTILLYLQRTKQLYKSRSYQNDQINKQMDQMYNLLAMCLVMHPQCVDESIQQALHKTYIDKITRMQNGDLTEFEGCFMISCPKFLMALPPASATTGEDFSKEATQFQLQIFMHEVQQQQFLGTIRSYLKLYKTMPMKKLASFMVQGQQAYAYDRDGVMEAAMRNLVQQLLCFKHKMRNLVWNKSCASSLDGQFQADSDLDFYIDNDMVHIADTKVATRHADVFIRKVRKFDEMRRKLKQLQL